ncbi:hypothetical protein VPH35_044917 [Triticum aestivum]
MTTSSTPCVHIAAPSLHGSAHPRPALRVALLHSATVRMPTSDQHRLKLVPMLRVSPPPGAAPGRLCLQRAAIDSDLRPRRLPPSLLAAPRALLRLGCAAASAPRPSSSGQPACRLLRARLPPLGLLGSAPPPTPQWRLPPLPCTRVRPCAAPHPRSRAGSHLSRPRPRAGLPQPAVPPPPPPPPSPGGCPAQVGSVARLRLTSHWPDLLPTVWTRPADFTPSGRARAPLRAPTAYRLPCGFPHPTHCSGRLPASGGPSACSGLAPPAPAGSSPAPIGPGPAPSASRWIRLPLCARGSARPPRFAQGRLRPRRADSAR